MRSGRGSRSGRRWLAGGLALALAVLWVALGSDLLVDRRIRLHSLVTLDPPPGIVTLERQGLVLAVTGASAQGPGTDPVTVLRAWAPTPTIRVIRAGPAEPVTLRIDNMPLRVRLSASGPVEEERSGATRTLRFSPPATPRLAFVAPNDAVTFAVLGDTGDSAIFSEALHVAALRGADFLIHAGDLIYEDPQVPHIERILTTAPVPVYMTRGNHDYRNAARIDFMRRLGPPYYAFRMGTVTFIVLDNAGDYLPGLWRRSTQYRWWVQRLAEPREGPLFVVMHKPPFDRRTGPYYAAMLDRRFARQLMQDFRQSGVDAVFTGHVHETHLWEEDGIPYVVNGEGMDNPLRPARNRMAWVRVRGGATTIEQLSIWRKGLGGPTALPAGAGEPW